MKQTMDLDSVHKLYWGITWAPAAQKEGTSCMVFGGTIQDGGHVMSALTPSLFQEVFKQLDVI